MIVDTFLYELAKKINGESSESPDYVAFSEDVITPDATDTSIPGILDGDAASGSRTLGVVTFNAIRSGAVASSSGDYINTLGLTKTSGSGTLFAEALVPSILHTTSYDLEVDWDITVSRA